MRSEHFETYQQGSRWWAVQRGQEHAPTPGATEAEALLAMCEQLVTENEAMMAVVEWT